MSQNTNCFREARIKEDHVINPDEMVSERNECGKRFSQAQYLLIHAAAGKGPLTFKQREKSFSRPESFQNHKRTHKKEHPYACNQCCKSYRKPHQLLAHKRTHTGEKPFTCNESGKSFSMAGSLHNHKKNTPKREAVYMQRM